MLNQGGERFSYRYFDGMDRLLGLPIVIYLFLGGTGAGACFVSSCMGLVVSARYMRRGHMQEGRSLDTSRVSSGAKATFRKFIGFGYVAASVFLLVGICSLLVDLGRTDRLFLLVTHPSLSYISIGAYSLVLCLLLAVFLAAICFLVFPALPRAAGIVIQGSAVVVSFVVMVYTGLLLANITPVPFWNSWCIPVLFALSAISCGISLMVLTACCTGVCGTLMHMVRVMIAVDFLVIVCEACATVVLLTVSLHGADPFSLVSEDFLEKFASTARMDLAALAAADLIAGDLSQWFWGGYVALGLVVPVILGAMARRNARVPQRTVLMFAMSVLFGGFIMRCCIVFAGTQAGSMI